MLVKIRKFLKERWYLLLLIAIILFIFSGFFISFFIAGMERGAMLREKEMPLLVTPTYETVPRAVPSPPIRVMIWTATLEMEVKNFDKIYQQVHSLAIGFGGYLLDSSSQMVRGRKTGYITIRVPTDKFYETIEAIEKLGDLEKKDVKGKEVTEEYTDLRARLAARQETERRYLNLLARAETVEDVLRVERELDRIRGEIESLIGRLRVLEEHIEMATIKVRMREPAIIEVVELLPEVDWRKTFASALWGTFAVIQGLIILIGYLLPFIIIGVIIWLVRKRVQKRRR